MKLLIVGCGYVGHEVARLARARGSTVYALTRSSKRFGELRDLGLEPIHGTWHDLASLGDLPAVERVLVSIPHRADAGQAVQTHASGLDNLLRALPAGWKKLVYLSTTGVYGDCENDLVDEHTPTSPTRIGPEIALAAEQRLGDTLPADQYLVLRLAGIYGPGRIPLAAKLRAGEPLAVPRQGHLNLAHVVDIARMIELVFDQAMQHPLYVFSDGQPVQREEFYRHLARLCGLHDPEFLAPEATDPRARRATNKRINPSRILAETHFEFRFPDYRAGLANALESSPA